MVEFDIRIATQQEIVYGTIETPENSMLVSICNYPGRDLLEKVDKHCSHMKPRNSLWDEVLQTGDRKANPVKSYASVGFIPRYIEHLSSDDEAYVEAAEVKAVSKVRPVYLIHGIKDKNNSPATLLRDFILERVDFDIATDAAV